jgi:hypothetical protein
MENQSPREIKDSFLEGMIDGIIMKTLWDEKTAKSKKGFGYLCGTLAIGAAQPLAYVCFGVDLIRGNYNE